MAKSARQEPCFIGCEVGLTRIRAGLFNDTFSLRSERKFSTKAERGPQAVLDRVNRCILDAVDEADLSVEHMRAAGIGIIGTVDSRSGHVAGGTPMEWEGLSLQNELEHRLHVPVGLESVGNLAALGVQTLEQHHAARRQLVLWLGCAVAGGLIHRGACERELPFGNAGMGHVVVGSGSGTCFCGQAGCLNSWASWNALRHRIRSATNDGVKTVLAELQAGRWEALRPKDLRKACKRGDPLANAIARDAVNYLGMGIALLANVLQPDVVVLTGDMLEGFESSAIENIGQTARRHMRQTVSERLQLVVSALGSQACIAGGAILARQRWAAARA